LNPYVKTEGKTIALSKGLKTETCGEGGMNVTNINNGEYIKVKGVDFGEGATSLDVRVASAGSGGSIEVRLDSQTGKLVGTCAVAGTGGAQTWATKTCAISDASGVHDLFFVFSGSGTVSLFNFNWWKFSGTPSDGGAGGQGGSYAGTSTGAAGSSGAGGSGGSSTSTLSGTAGSGGSNVGGRSGGTGGSAGGRTGSVAGGTSGNAGSGGITNAGGTSSSNGGQTQPGGASASGGVSGAPGRSAAPGGDTGSGGGASGTASSQTSSSKAAAGDSSGCSCELGRSPERHQPMLGFAFGVALLIFRRRRSGPQ
jgi:arabinoxylan arabinofuranohydrolase